MSEVAFAHTGNQRRTEKDRLQVAKGFLSVSLSLWHGMSGRRKVLLKVIILGDSG